MRWARLVLGSLRRARRADRATRPGWGRLATIGVCALAGFMIAWSGLNSAGSDLRPNRSTELAGLVSAQAERNKALSSRVSELRGSVDRLAAKAAEGGKNYEPELKQSGAHAALSAVKGPALQVKLDDAPLDVKPAGVAPDLLVVHQQDIQAVVNALWSGGAEAMTIQGVRVTSTTGIKCVGNSVVLKGVPYAPPYVITAIGDPARMEAALTASKDVQIFQQYVRSYQLGYEQHRLGQVTLPGFEGSIDLNWARADR